MLFTVTAQPILAKGLLDLSLSKHMQKEQKPCLESVSRRAISFGSISRLVVFKSIASMNQMEDDCQQSLVGWDAYLRASTSF